MVSFFVLKKSMVFYTVIFIYMTSTRNKTIKVENLDQETLYANVLTDVKDFQSSTEQYETTPKERCENR